MLQLQSNSPYLSIYKAPERCDAPVNAKLQLLSLPFSEDSIKEIHQYSQGDAPVNMEASATIEISLPPSKGLTRDTLQ